MRFNNRHPLNQVPTTLSSSTGPTSSHARQTFCMMVHDTPEAHCSWRMQPPPMGPRLASQSRSNNSLVPHTLETQVKPQSGGTWRIRGLRKSTATITLTVASETIAMVALLTVTQPKQATEMEEPSTPVETSSFDLLGVRGNTRILPGMPNVTDTVVSLVLGRSTVEVV